MLNLCALQLRAQAPDIKYPSPQTFIGVNNVTIKPINLGGAATSYSVNKPLPGTLVLDAATGIISGQASVPAYPDDYVITASNASGTSSATIRIEISHNYGLDPRVTPSPIFSYPAPQKFLYQLNAPIVPLSPNSFPLSADPYGLVSTLTKQASSQFSKLASIVEGPAGVFYVTDQVNNVIKTVGPDGATGIFAGIPGQTGNTNGPKASATFNSPVSVVFDRSFNAYVVDAGNNSIRKISNADGTVSTFASTGLNNPASIAIDNDDNIYVADLGNRVIKKISSAGLVNIFAGSGASGSANGAALSATFTSPAYIATDFDGNVYVTDIGTNSIRKISTAGIVSTIAGVGGHAAAVNIGKPAGLKVSAAGNIYFGDTLNNLIYELDSGGQLTVVTGAAGQGYLDGDIATAKFDAPVDVAFTKQGVLYVADQNNQKIRPVNLAGYSIDKPLPPGLTFDSVRGIISGTTTAVSPPAYYLVTGHNQMGASSTYVNIEVRDIPLVDQTLTFPPIDTKSVCSADFDLHVTSTTDPNSPPPVSRIKYTSSDIHIAGVSPTGVVHMVGAGTVQITASMDGDIYHKAASSVSQSFTVTSPPIPIVDINIDKNGVCKGDPATFTASIENADQVTNPSYQWQINGKNVGTNDKVYKVVVGRQDLVSCIVTNHASCDVIGTIYGQIALNESPALEVHITPSLEGIICLGSSITFTATAGTNSTNLSYQWHLNGKSIGTNSATYTSTTFAEGDKITCTVEDKSSPCQAPGTSTEATINFGRQTNPDATVTVTASANNVYYSTTVVFTAVAANMTGDIKYQWLLNGKNVGTNATTFTSSTLENGDVITCVATALNACYPPVVSQSVTETITPLPVITPPTAFTPNGDGINDLWQIPGLNIIFPNCTVAVYNRYGKQLYYSRGYAKPWNGLLNGGADLPVGTYYYVIELVPRRPKLTGYVAIVR